MISYPPALRQTGFIAPKAIGRMGVAIMEARAHAEQPKPPVAPVSAKVVPMPVPPRERTVIRLWLPSTLIFLLLAPFALLLAPLLYFAPRNVCPRPFATVIGVGAMLLALGGTLIDVDAPDARVLIRIF